MRSIRQGLLQASHYDQIEFGFLNRSTDAMRALWRVGAHRQASAAADFLLSTPVRAGLFPTTYNIHSHRWGTNELFPKGAAYSARMIGETLDGLLAFAGDIQTDQPDRAFNYRKLAETTLLQVLHKQSRDGHFCKYWDKNGVCIEGGVTNGFYLVAALLRLYRQSPTPSTQLSAGILRGLDRLTQAITQEDYWGAALDSDCTDKESGIIALHTLILALQSNLGHSEQRARWLHSARQAAAFVASWTFLYSVPFAPQTPLAQMGYDTLGGTAVSVAHPHLDFYGIKAAPDFWVLADLLSNDASKRDEVKNYRTLAQLLTQYSGQLIARPENRYLGTDEAWRLGWQPEQQYQTTWTMLPYGFLGNRRGGFFHSLAWISGLQLGAFLDLEEVGHPALPDGMLKTQR